MSAMPIKTDLKLQARLGQIPKIWQSKAVPKTDYDPEVRSRRLREGEPIASYFPSIAYSFVLKNIPIAYLEGYQTLCEMPKRSKWPTSPKVIFTSVAYYDDDVFKQYAAEHVDEGAKLLIGQHGGYYGTSPFSFQEEI